MAGNQQGGDGTVLSAELLRNSGFLTTVGVGIVVQDTSGSILEVNDSACELLGMSRDRLLGAKSFLPQPIDSDRGDGGDRPSVDATSASTSGPNRPPGRSRILKLDQPGQDPTLLVASSRIVAVSDAACIVTTSLVDITEAVGSRNASLESELAESRSIMEITLESLVDPHALLKVLRNDQSQLVDFYYVDVNRSACADMQMNREQLIGAHLLDVLVGESAADLFAQLAHAADSGEPLLLDDFVYHGDGSTPDRHLDIRAIKVDDSLSCTWRDITNRVASAEHFRLLAENATDIVFETDQDLCITWISPSVRSLLGWEPANLLGRHALELVAEVDMEAALQARSELAELGVGPTLEIRLRTADGGTRWMRAQGKAVAGTSDAVFVVGMSDIEDVMVEREVRAESEERYRLLLENESDVVIRCDLDTTIEWISPSVMELGGCPPDRVVGHRISEYLRPQDQSGLAVVVGKVIGGASAAFQCQVRTKGGEYRWVSARIRPLFDDDEAAIGGVVTARDVHDEVIARDALAESEKRFRLALESAPIGISVSDLDRRYVEVNPALCVMVGRDEQWLTTHRFPDILDPADDIQDLRRRAELLAGRSLSTPRECRLLRPDGSRVWVEHSIGLLRDATGQPLSYVSTYVDITDTKAAREKLSYQATHDMLTHLLNRHDLFDRAHEMMTLTKRTGTNVGALYIDVDNLKVINDTYGHAAGDQALIRLADRLMASCRSDDIISRVGGDEFVILLPGLHAVADAEEVATKIIAAFDDAVTIDGHSVHMSVSIGVALADPEEDAEVTLRHADSALMRAKHSGRGVVATYDPELD